MSVMLYSLFISHSPFIMYLIKYLLMLCPAKEHQYCDYDNDSDEAPPKYLIA